MDSHLTIFSYDCTGFGPGKPEYVSELINAHGFVLFQEHWSRYFHRIKNMPDNNVTILSHDVCGIYNHVFLSGRGYGGCSISWKISYKCIMNSNRIFAVNITTHNMSLFLFNVYMPCDIRSNDDL